jgi:hypothetical protein
MAAKALFLGICLNGPLIAAQLYLLSVAEIPITPELIPGLALLQLEFVLLTLPTATLAAITETLVQWVLAVIGMLLFTMVMSWLPWNILPVTLPGAENTATWLIGVLLVMLLSFVLFWQYMRRRVCPARVAVACAVLSIPAIVAVASSQWMRSIAYPPQTHEALLRVTLDDNKYGEREYTRTRHVYNSDPTIRFHISTAPASPDTYVYIEGSRVILNGDEGWRWESAWSRRDWAQINQNDDQATLSFQMPNHLADQISTKHTTATVELALAVYKLGVTSRIDTSAGRFVLPGGVACHWPDPENDPHRKSLVCYAPFRLPELLETRIESGEDTCPVEPGESPLPAGHTSTGINWDTGFELPEFDPNPVHSFVLSRHGWAPAISSEEQPNSTHEIAFCPGTPLTVRIGSLDRRISVSVTLGSLGNENGGERPEEEDVPDK